MVSWMQLILVVSKICFGGPGSIFRMWSKTVFQALGWQPEVLKISFGGSRVLYRMYLKNVSEAADPGSIKKICLGGPGVFLGKWSKTVCQALWWPLEFLKI